MSKITYISDFIKRKRCKHPMINEYHNGGFCPDCGQKVTIKWQTVRCSHCDMLHMQKVTNGKISPLKKYCLHCGSGKWYVRTDYKIPLSQRFYANYIKVVTNEDIVNLEKDITEVWVEKPDFNDDYKKY